MSIRTTDGKDGIIGFCSVLDEDDLMLAMRFCAMELDGLHARRNVRDSLSGFSDPGATTGEPVLLEIDHGRRRIRVLPTGPGHSVYGGLEHTGKGTA